MTERESVTREDLTDIVDLIRPAISSAYYDARNAGETMEDAASRAAGAVLAILQLRDIEAEARAAALDDASEAAIRAEAGTLDVERLADMVTAACGASMPQPSYRLYEPKVRASFIERYRRAAEGADKV